MRISDWSSDVCSSDLRLAEWEVAERALRQCHSSENSPSGHVGYWLIDEGRAFFSDAIDPRPWTLGSMLRRIRRYPGVLYRSEEHTSELQSLMRNSYAVFCLKKKNKHKVKKKHHT